MTMQPNILGDISALFATIYYSESKSILQTAPYTCTTLHAPGGLYSSVHVWTVVVHIALLFIETVCVCRLDPSSVTIFHAALMKPLAAVVKEVLIVKRTS